jgi:hypothetical protein
MVRNRRQRRSRQQIAERLSTSLGFRATGEIDEGEIALRRDLDAAGEARTRSMQ